MTNSSTWHRIDDKDNPPPDYGKRFLGAYKTRRGEWVCEVVAWESQLTTVSGKVFPATHWMPLPPPPTEDTP